MAPQRQRTWWAQPLAAAASEASQTTTTPTVTTAAAATARRRAKAVMIASLSPLRSPTPTGLRPPEMPPPRQEARSSGRPKRTRPRCFLLAPPSPALSRLLPCDLPECFSLRQRTQQSLPNSFSLAQSHSLLHSTLSSSILLIAASALFLLAQISPPVHGAPPLERRDEAYQPYISREFPHILGPNRMLSWLNKSVDPCEDFYQYACGGFIQKYEDVPHADTLELMQTTNTLLMEEILSQRQDKISKTPAERRVFAKAINYYRSCLDSETINARGFEPIVPLAKEFNTLFEKQSFTSAFGKMNSKAVYFLFKTSYSRVQNEDPNDLRLQFFPATGYDVTVKTVIRALKPFVDRRILTIPPDTTLESIAEWIVKVEKMTISLIKTQNSANLWADAGSSRMSLWELSQKTGMDWNEYLQPLNLTGIDKIYFWGDRGTWIKTLTAIAKFDRKAMSYIALWRLATTHYSKLGRKWFNLWAQRIWTNAVQSTVDEENDDKSEIFQVDCVAEMGVHLNYLAGHVFNRYAFNETQRKAATKMIDGLFVAYREIVSKLTWMDDATRSAALRKLDNTIRIVGYPDWMSDADQIDAYHSDLSISPSMYFENAVQVHAHSEYAWSIHQRGRPLERNTLFFGFPWQLNAFHLSDYVQVQINSGIIQRPIFSAFNPDLMNYASLGVIIGHEITHSFDAHGHIINADGIMQPWWSAESNSRFNAQAGCFERQYGAYDVVAFKDGRTKPVNGVRTVSENIADNGGLSVALQAWRNLEGVKETENDRSAGFEGWTPLQAFFVAFGQTWCTVPDYAQTRFLLKDDAHPPNEVRIRGALANSPDFAKAFKCKPGSPMSPPDSDRCFLY
ncbi:hypothetical protein DFJ73DRAFT_368450 [Zopfochytrium polystomum]|nr:hypothetical protein DFJ73DRAFT_368450 [Zopfochytrium polystomum]